MKRRKSAIGYSILAAYAAWIIETDTYWFYTIYEGGNMKFTRVKTTLMAGVMAASMVMPGMAVYADVTTDDATPASATAPTVEKRVRVADGITIPDNITFSVTQYDTDNDSTNGYTNADGTKQQATISGIPNLTVYASSEDSSVTALNTTPLVEDKDDASKNNWDNGNGYESAGANKKGTVTLGTDFTSLLTENGEYTFELKEITDGLSTNESGYGWTDKASNSYYLHVYVTDKTGDGETGKNITYIVTSGIEVNRNEKNEITSYKDKVSEIVFKNTYTKRAGEDTTPKAEDPEDTTHKKGASLVVEKTIDGKKEYESSTAKYEFTIELISSNTYTVAEDQTYAYQIYNSDGTAAGSGTNLTLDANKKGKIELKSGQYAVFSNIPAGVKASIKESNTGTNIKETHYTVVSNGVKTDNDQKGTEKQNILLGEKENSVTFRNTYSDVTVTGVVTNIAPYVTLVIVAVAAVAAYMGIKNRIAR